MTLIMVRVQCSSGEPGPSPYVFQTTATALHAHIFGLSHVA